jgi:3-dehydroquinate synthase
MPKSIKIKTKSSPSSYEIRIGQGVLRNAGVLTAEFLGRMPERVAFISNRKVFGLYGAEVTSSVGDAGALRSVSFMGEGERFKNLRTLVDSLEFFSTASLSRTDAVVALGGGVVGDLTGFAASVYLRGIPFIQVPTTLLSMIDSSVGGKTGINTPFGKNLVGAFYQPKGVIIDTDTLKTLPPRELTAGFCEAVKQGAIAGKELFELTEAILRRRSGKDLRHQLDDRAFSSHFAEFLREQLKFKARIVSGDEKEASERTDALSRKILNFGHTLAHALEKVTKFRYFRHGEAVGHGIKFAASLSKNLGLLSKDEVTLLYDVVHMAGRLPAVAGIDPRDVFAALKHDKKVIDGSLQWILLKGIGEPVIVPHAELDRPAMKAAFKDIVRS